MSPSIRLGLCLAALTSGLLLSADFFLDVLPDRTGPVLQARKQFCESLAVQFSSFAERSDHSPMQRTMRSVVERSPDVLSVGLRLANGNLLSSTEGHAEAWGQQLNDESTATHTNVPIFAGGSRWGTLEVRFAPIGGPWYVTLSTHPLLRLVAIVATLGFAIYALFMKRTLRYLDPNAVVPGRVKTALDQLVEGVVLLDRRSQIVLANQAFAHKLDCTAAALVGKNISELSWCKIESPDQTSSSQEAGYPWVRARDEGVRVTEARLVLATPNQGLRVLTSNASPIVDGSGHQHGVLASFDDISEIELVNRELNESLAQLRESEQEIRRQNTELERLANVDPLTEALNRRAFFEKLEAEYALARKQGLALSCIMADIDHFKNVNDTYGHATGDDVIKGMARVLSENCNSNGAVGRYGGEEFCVVLPGVEMEEAMQIADRIRVTFKAWSEVEDSPTGGKTLTSSFGVSAVNCGSKDADAMVDQADQALYRSKTSGRNQVSSWTQVGSRYAATG